MSRELKRGLDDGLKTTDLDADLVKLEAELKRQCLVNFDYGTCMRTMYKKDNSKATSHSLASRQAPPSPLTDVITAREIFLTLDDETVSWEFLESQKRHYKLDTLLRRVHISNSVSIHWDDASAATRKTATSWKCADNFDFFMVFQWLKKEIQVKKILEVVVDDGASRGMGTDDLTVCRKMPHSDRAIIECLKDLDVETIDWQRADIPADVIVSAAPNVKTLYLYCSGLRAVLQGWANRNGLAKLRKVLSTSPFGAHAKPSC